MLPCHFPQLLTEKKNLVEAMAQALLEKEVLNGDELEKLLGKRPFSSQVRPGGRVLQSADRGGRRELEAWLCV